MKLRRFSGMLLGISLLVTVPAALAGETSVTTTGNLGVFSKYIFRGYEQSKDSLVLQPAVTLGWQGLEVGFWGNLDTRDKFTRTEKTNWNETDLILAYTRKLGPVNTTLGFIYYALDNADDSQEIYLKLAGDTFLTPTLSIYREFGFYPGWYLNFSLGHSIPLTQTITLDLGAAVGYQISDTEKILKYTDRLLPTQEKYQALHDGQITLGLTIPFYKYFALKPMVAYSTALSDEAKNRIKGVSLVNRYDFFYGGITFSAAF